jgi:hypothetical protein
MWKFLQPNFRDVPLRGQGSEMGIPVGLLHSDDRLIARLYAPLLSRFVLSPMVAPTFETEILPKMHL